MKITFSCHFRSNSADHPTLKTLAENPDSGVVVLLSADERLHTAMIEKITLGEVDKAYTHPGTGQDDKTANDPMSLKTPEEQAAEKALKTVEAELRQQAEGDNPQMPAQKETALNQVIEQERAALLNGEQSLEHAKTHDMEKATQLERQHQQRDTLRQQEREIVIEKDRDREIGD